MGKEIMTAGEFVALLKSNLSGKPKDFEIYVRETNGTVLLIKDISVANRQVMINVVNPTR